MHDSRHPSLRAEIAAALQTDRGLLDGLRTEIRPLRDHVRRLNPRQATAISLVGADGGNNQVRFDPFLVQIIRVVDSSANEYCLDVVTPTTSIVALSARQFHPDGSPRTALGHLMAYLNVRTLPQLSHMIRIQADGYPVSPNWIKSYRELVEWAILFTIIREKDFGTDTLLVYDGLLRTKAFAGDLFQRTLQGIKAGIERQQQQHRRRLYLAGVAKHSKVLDRYRLAMALEQVLTTNYPAYVEIPREIEERAYLHVEYARGDDRELAPNQINRYVGGKMFFVKFGRNPRDPIWPIDLAIDQVHEAPAILGAMYADALNGFPVPFYPRCLQRAHEHAAVVDFDADIMQDDIFAGIRALLAEESSALDLFRLQEHDPARRRYAQE
jgi:hypothetical protein